MPVELEPDDQSGSFDDDDEHDVDRQSYYSGSDRSGEGSRSYYSGEEDDSRSRYSDEERSYYSGDEEEGSYISRDGDGSRGSRRRERHPDDGDDRSYDSRGSGGSRSYDSRGSQSYHSRGSQSYDSRGSRSYDSRGSRSYDSRGSRSYSDRSGPYSDEVSYDSREGSQRDRDDDAPYSDDDRSYYSGEEGSQRSRSSRSYDSRGSQGSRSYDSRGSQSYDSRGSRSYDSRGGQSNSVGSGPYSDEESRRRNGNEDASYSNEGSERSGVEEEAFYSEEVSSKNMNGSQNITKEEPHPENVAGVEDEHSYNQQHVDEASQLPEQNSFSEEAHSDESYSKEQGEDNSRSVEDSPHPSMQSPVDDKAPYSDEDSYSREGSQRSRSEGSYSDECSHSMGGSRRSQSEDQGSHDSQDRSQRQDVNPDASFQLVEGSGEDRDSQEDRSEHQDYQNSVGAFSRKSAYSEATSKADSFGEEDYTESERSQSLRGEISHEEGGNDESVDTQQEGNHSSQENSEGDGNEQSDTQEEEINMENSIPKSETADDFGGFDDFPKDAGAEDAAFDTSDGFAVNDDAFTAQAFVTDNEAAADFEDAFADQAFDSEPAPTDNLFAEDAFGENAFVDSTETDPLKSEPGTDQFENAFDTTADSSNKNALFGEDDDFGAFGRTEGNEAENQGDEESELNAEDALASRDLTQNDPDQTSHPQHQEEDISESHHASEPDLLEEIQTSDQFNASLPSKEGQGSNEDTNDHSGSHASEPDLLEESKQEESQTSNQFNASLPSKEGEVPNEDTHSHSGSQAEHSEESFKVEQEPTESFSNRGEASTSGSESFSRSGEGSQVSESVSQDDVSLSVDEASLDLENAFEETQEVSERSRSDSRRSSDSRSYSSRSRGSRSYSSRSRGSRSYSSRSRGSSYSRGSESYGSRSYEESDDKESQNGEHSYRGEGSTSDGSLSAPEREPSSDDDGSEPEDSFGELHQFEKKNESKDNISSFEASMQLGDVFGQPNELFEDHNADKENSGRSSHDDASGSYSGEDSRGTRGSSLDEESKSTRGSSFDRDSRGDEDSDGAEGKDSFGEMREFERKDSKGSTNFEMSMKLGEVFGKPNELFDDHSASQHKSVSGHSKGGDTLDSMADISPNKASTQQDPDESYYEDEDEFNKSLPKPQDFQRFGVNKHQSNTARSERSEDSTLVSSPGGSKNSRTDTLPSVTSSASPGNLMSTVPPPGQAPLQTDSSQDRDSKTVSSDTVSRKSKNTDASSRADSKRKKKKKRRKRKNLRSPALLDFVANINEAMEDFEEDLDDPQNLDASAHKLLLGFEALLGIFLQLSDELELISTFSKMKKRKDPAAMVPVDALEAVLTFAEVLDQLFEDVRPILEDCFDEEPDDDMEDMLYRLNSLVDLLCETTHRVGEKQEWNDRAETTYATLIELMEFEILELGCYIDDVDPPEYELSAMLSEAWHATGHIEELRALQIAGDPWLFRQICYEVMISTDQWCPDTSILMEICGIDPSLLDEEPDQDYLDEEEIAPIPQAAEHILDKVNGDPLQRTIVLGSILRRILPPRAIIDNSLLDHFTSIRNTLDSPLGLSPTNIVSITSVPEVLNDEEALGVGGMGKSTLAAMVASHPDVRRYFIDGVVWVYVGDKELNYNRYTQCLRELVAQLDWYQGVPLFAELLHTPGEPLSKRRRREEGFMIYARDTIAELLNDRSVLIILDDVCFEPDLDWFDFAPMPGEAVDEENTCALLVTTRCRALLPAADTVEVDMLDEAEAINLLIQESGQLSHSLMAESREARSVVRECANHPLAVKSVGRWLNLKHATAGVVSSVEEIHAEVIKSMEKILKGGDHNGSDMMYEVLSMSLSPSINGEPTTIIKFCLAAFVVVFCNKQYLSDFALTESSPIIPMDMAELLFETLLEINESSLLQEGSLFYDQKKEAAVLIPEALSALGVLKVITYSDSDFDDNPEDDQKFLQIMHFIHQEYGEYLCKEEESLQDLTKDAERQWNRALVEAYLAQIGDWDMDIEELEDARNSYALEMIVTHMIRGQMFSTAAELLANKSFVRGRLLSLGRENATRRHVKDCEVLFQKLTEHRVVKGRAKLEPRTMMKQAYQALGSQLMLEDDEHSAIDPRIRDLEVARAHYEIGFSLAEKRCWDAAIAHWETSQELLVDALGTVEVVAGILYNVGVVYAEMNEYEKALDSLKQCLRIRGTIHEEKHILYAQTIHKIGDIFLAMSDYHEAMESYNWALDVMYSEPSHHRVDIGEILDNKGNIHYSKGEIDEALQCHQDALRSKQVDLGEDHPELASTYHQIGNCLSDQGNIEDAIVHFEEAIRLKGLDPEGGPERDSDVLTIEGVLYNLEGDQEHGLECYEKSLQILVTKVPHRKEKVASLLHLIGCVYLMSGEQKKAMKLFEESLQARRKVLGFVHLDVASTLFNMAFLHQTRNRLDKALKCLEEALKIRQLRLPDSEKVAVTHEKIGIHARTIGKTKKAQIAFEEALRIRRIVHGEQHEAVATVLQELGELMDDLGEYDYAMNYFIDALDIRRNRLGPDDVAVAETLYSMGFTLHNNDASDRALVCFEESLSIRRFQLGEDSKEVGDTLNMMGFLKARQGELEDALALLWDALRIRKLQEDHIKVSETLKNIGIVHREKQEYDLAVECYEECLRIRIAELGPEHEKVADALIAMGMVLGDMEKPEDSMRSYQEALRIRTTVFGEHDENVAQVLQYMGTLEARLGNNDKARDLLSEFIRIRRENDAKNDGHYVNVLFLIGNIHKIQGNQDEAQLCWAEAYQVFSELGLAETNPQIAEIMSDLVTLKAEMKEEDASESKKKNKGGGVFGNLLGGGKTKDKNADENKISKKRNRKGKGQQLGD